MGWKIYDYECPECEEIFEDLGKSSELITECKFCDCKEAKRLVPGPRVGVMNDPEVKKDALRKRSEEHTKREQRKGNLRDPREAARDIFVKKR